MLVAVIPHLSKSLHVITIMTPAFGTCNNAVNSFIKPPIDRIVINYSNIAGCSKQATTRISAKTPLAPYFLVLPLLFSSWRILYTGFEETMKHFTVNFHPFSIYERTPFLPRCALEAHKGLSALMRLQIVRPGARFIKTYN